MRFLIPKILALILLLGAFSFASGQSVTYIKGSGSPESVVTAPIGSLYVRTDGSTGTTLYVKESGTGNTGWVAVAAGGGAVSSVSATNSTLTISPTTGAVSAALNVGNTNTWTALQTLTLDNATTNAVSTVLDVQKSSSGTPAAGMGAQVRFGLESTTTANQFAGSLGAIWNIATNASRNSYVSVSAADVASVSEVARFQGVASSVNYFNLFPSATGQVLELGADGTDTDIGISIAPKGTGVVTINTDPVATENNTLSFTNKSLTDSSNVLGGVTMTLGSDANGDTYYRAGGVLSRLAIGSAGACLVVNGGGTAPEWGSCAGGGGGANQLLSNLTAGSVAINTSLVSDTDNTDDLGTSSIRWQDLHLSGGLKGDTSTLILGVTSAGSAVNYLDVQNAATGSGPTLSALGSDTNVPFNIQSKGTGVINLTITPSTTNTTDTVLGLIRNSSGTPANNIGAAFNYYIGTTTTPSTLAGGQSMRWEDATHASRTSRWWWTTISSAGGLTERMGLDHNGIRLPEISSAATPAANNVYVYAKDNGSGVSKLYYKGDDGTEVGPLAAAGGSGITIGTTTVTSGTATRLLYETSGNVVGEISGATSNGTIVTLTSPVITTADITSTMAVGGGSGTSKFVGAVKSVAPNTTTSTTSEETLDSYSIPANSLNANGRAIRVRAWLSQDATGNSKTIKLTLGGTTLATVTFTASSGTVLIEATITRSASNTQNSYTTLFRGSSVGAWADELLFNAITTETDTSSITLAVKATTAVAAGSVTLRGFLVEFIN